MSLLSMIVKLPVALVVDVVKIPLQVMDKSIGEDVRWFENTEKALEDPR